MCTERRLALCLSNLSYTGSIVTAGKTWSGCSSLREAKVLLVYGMGPNAGGDEPEHGR